MLYNLEMHCIGIGKIVDENECVKTFVSYETYEAHLKEYRGRSGFRVSELIKE